jgi:hypothetical protein
LPWRAFRSVAWQDAHSALRTPVCGWWQLAQARWPAGAVRFSAAWQVAHARGGVRGAWRALAWQPAQLR